MTIKRRHIALIIGLISINLSALFFVRPQFAYLTLWIGGFFVTLISLLAIIISDDTKRTKLFWTVIFILSLVVQQFFKPQLIDISARSFINQNEAELIELSNILLEKQGNITIKRDTILDENKELTNNERIRLQELRGEVDSYYIWKKFDLVYIELWGFLDNRFGVTYSPNDTLSKKDHRQLNDKWYR